MNDITSTDGMFPHGSQDVTFMCHMKIARALGYEKAENWLRMEDELLDLINYGAFALVLLDLEKKK